MKYTDILEETYFSLSGNKARSSLTILGIVIGISSVIVMLAIGQGAQGSIESSIQSLGSNLIMVTPGAQRGVGMQVSGGRGTAKTLTQEDSEAIAKEILDAEAISPEVSGRYQVIYKGANTNTSIVGTNSYYPIVRNADIDLGYFISDQNVKSLSKVAVIGSTVKTDLFGEDALSEDAVGQTIKIKGIEFKIIGTMKTKGGTGFGSQDDMIFIPISVAQKYLAGDSYVSTINIKASDSSLMTSIQEQVKDLLLIRHNITDSNKADFSVINQADIVASASSITGTVTMLLAAVAGISLVVGGIGIMNMMLTTVTERTREIGLRKAIGAKRKDIVKQFLIEAIVLTILGGIIGVILGVSASYLFSYFGIIQTKISISSIWLAFGVSAIIGVAFGYYPAKRAATLNPIEALRYE